MTHRLDPQSPHGPVSAASPRRLGRVQDFQATIMEGLRAPAVVAPARSLFDVCHPGVVLRTLGFVYAVLGIGVLFVAPNFSVWNARVVAGALIATPALAMWLLLACGLRQRLTALAPLWRWIFATAMGAVCAAGVAWVAVPALENLLPGGFGPHPLIANAAAGAGLAGAIWAWLQWRNRAQMPADVSARLAELQSRIRPHFLFNTLNTALALVRVDPARAEGVLEDLAELFRFALANHADSSGQAVSVSLAEEVELARRYLAIEQLRFGERLSVVWELDPAANPARMPPLLLQPLVENAVRHGIEPTDAGGTIRIRTRVRLGRAVVSVANTIPELGIPPSRTGNGIALRNVRERLRLMHDVAAQFEIKREKNIYRVELMVPL